MKSGMMKDLRRIGVDPDQVVPVPWDISLALTFIDNERNTVMTEHEWKQEAKRVIRRCLANRGKKGWEEKQGIWDEYDARIIRLIREVLDES